MRRREILAAGLAALAVPRGARASALRKFGGTVTAGLLEKSSANPRTLDPHLARTRLERELAAAIHVPLFARARPHFSARNAGLLVEQAAPLARDGRSFALTLRPGITFSDGAPMLAADVVASLQRSIKSPAGRALAMILGEVRAKDELHVEIETRVAVTDPASLLSSASASIVPAKFSGDTPPGLGGFRVASAAAGEIVLEANTKSPAGRAWLDKLRIVPADEAAFRRGAQQAISGGAGDHDCASTIALVLSPKLAAEMRAKIAGAPDLKVLTEVFLQGRATAATSLIPPALLGPLAIRAPLTARAHAPKPASQTALSLFVADASPEIKTVADRVVWDLLEVGVAARVGVKAPDALEDAIASDRYDLAITEWVPCEPDAGRSLAGASKDPVLAGAIGDAANALVAIDDVDTRTTAAVLAARKIAAAGLVVPLVHPRRAVRSANLTGAEPDALGFVDWSEVSK